MSEPTPSPQRPPRCLRGVLSGPSRLLAHAAVVPVRLLARRREPAVADPKALRPGDIPPVGGRLLLLFDGGCGICLHARDVFAALDRNERLAFDQIARHDGGLLADLAPEARYGAWHVIYPDGRMVSGAAGVAASFAALPPVIGWLPATLMRRFPRTADRGYQWFVVNRGWISRGSGLINHPQRDPREQLHHPEHAQVL